MVWTAMIGLGVLAVVGYALTLYNGFVELRNQIGRTWANIDVSLKQRHDELPKLVKTCEGYMQHERAVFDKLSEARAALAKAGSVGQRAEAEGMLTRALGGFFAVAEAYPDLKANQSFIQLQNRITELENQIADRREVYNDVVTIFNTRLGSIPDKFVGDWMKLAAAELFKVAESDRQDVDISFKMAS
ncbi:MAG: LemA family protein [Candidatus Eisenbacteria bacterium]|uniref:LemA family protein n=1 Tax=Eiseniibacteriota bacterium TaxID=2212470 RepID=A0A849T2C6_UNCEI|nr:LemA family protein [Candidatus Eisenbacteria bacterium]